MKIIQNPDRHAAGRKYPAVACYAALQLFGAAHSATLSNQSSVGLSSEYASNPFLLPSGAHAAESAAVLADLPATYDDDAQSLELEPRVRWAQTHGDIALLSDYQYLDGIYRLTSERNTFSLSAGWHRDSTLYNTFENSALLGRDLRRFEETANLSWQRALTELSSLSLIGSFDQVGYSQNIGSTLGNFRYDQAALQYQLSLSERWQWTSSAGVALYQLRDQSYSSDNRFLQTSLVRALSEEWSLTAQVGYSNLTLHQQSLVCCQLVEVAGGYELQFIPVKQSGTRGTGNYALSAERKTERVTLDFAASRVIEPSGLGALLTQDDYSVRASEAWTTRLNLSGTLHFSRLADPFDRLQLGDRRYYDADLGANWLWTEHWTLGLQASYIVQRLSAQTPVGSGLTVYLNLSRQFGRLRL